MVRRRATWLAVVLASRAVVVVTGFGGGGGGGGGGGLGGGGGGGGGGGRGGGCSRRQAVATDPRGELTRLGRAASPAAHGYERRRRRSGVVVAADAAGGGGAGGGGGGWVVGGGETMSRGERGERRAAADAEGRRSLSSWLASVSSIAVFAASAFMPSPAFAENELAAMADGKFNPDLVSSECFGACQVAPQ